MPLAPSSSLLGEILRLTPRRYRLPAMATASLSMANASPAEMLALAVEQARAAVAREEVPDAAIKSGFIEALAHLIREAICGERGDPAFQAMVLRHRAATVREYASLSEQADKYRRQVHAAINALAHPAKRQRMQAGLQREGLAKLHASAGAASWSAVVENLGDLIALPEISDDSPLARDLSRLLDSPALAHLQRLDVLAEDDFVHQYRLLRDRHSPRSGSATAQTQGGVSQQRGAAVEALAAHALEALARRLNEAQEAGMRYRIVTSMRVPPSIPASAERAKSEWDAVLLGQGKTADAGAPWNVCLLVEAKASVDAAATDLARLLRGLRLLAHADENTIYQFETRQGTVALGGASLSALAGDEASVANTVLYCCDAPEETAPRLLSAAGRMQLLSASASLAFACALAGKHNAAPQDLEPVWHELLTSPRWRTVLNQYPMLRQVRELMIHPDDLLATVDGAR